MASNPLRPARYITTTFIGWNRRFRWFWNYHAVYNLLIDIIEIFRTANINCMSWSRYRRGFRSLPIENVITSSRLEIMITILINIWYFCWRCINYNICYVLTNLIYFCTQKLIDKTNLCFMFSLSYLLNFFNSLQL